MQNREDTETYRTGAGPFSLWPSKPQSHQSRTWQQAAHLLRRSNVWHVLRVWLFWLAWLKDVEGNILMGNHSFAPPSCAEFMGVSCKSCLQLPSSTGIKSENCNAWCEDGQMRTSSVGDIQAVEDWENMFQPSNWLLNKGHQGKYNMPLSSTSTLMDCCSAHGFLKAADVKNGPCRCHLAHHFDRPVTACHSN